jgi:hypothetical protein
LTAVKLLLLQQPLVQSQSVALQLQQALSLLLIQHKLQAPSPYWVVQALLSQQRNLLLLPLLVAQLQLALPRRLLQAL